MKAFFCGLCSDIRGLQVNPVTCRCGNVEAWWVNPHTGKYAIRAKVKSRARIIGLHNEFLCASFCPAGQKLDWKETHDKITREADGYLFHTKHRNCWAAVIVPGESSDGGWAPDNRPHDELMETGEFWGHIQELVIDDHPTTRYLVELYDKVLGWKKVVDCKIECLRVARAVLENQIESITSKRHEGTVIPLPDEADSAKPSENKPHEP